MFTSVKRRTFAASLLVACSLALFGLTAQGSSHDGPVRADSAWGFVTPSQPVPADPAPEITLADDSAWG
ncbi:hypothetical protein [Streptomyces sp. MBT27]|uniref:hypothetical protein n=1 Tax=Streptomyces sp. MBT27 TaxID=1488356 RepID=UPI00141E1DD4|nr:hypothetical protein [Streptomyces sp. MBT27]